VPGPPPTPAQQPAAEQLRLLEESAAYTTAQERAQAALDAGPRSKCVYNRTFLRILGTR
jgi:hypothetical protein